MNHLGITVRTLAAVAAWALLVASATAQGEVMVVNTLEDVTDFGGRQRVADLPGPDGLVSFREACIAANNTAGPQTIEFAIPQAEWWLFSDRALLRQENGIFPLDDDGTFVDFSTQAAFTGDTNPNGGEVGIYGLEPNSWGVASIYINGNGCTIKGLDRVMQRGYAVQIQGDGNRVIGSTISGPLHRALHVTGGFGGPTPTGNVIGGTAPGEGNVLSGIKIAGPVDGTVVVGNVIRDTLWVVSAPSSGMIASNTRIGGPTPAERNAIFGAGRYGEEGFPTGAQILLEQAIGTLIEGNFIGTADGLTAASQIGPTGIEVRASDSTTIRGNVIGGMRTVGVNHYAGQVFGEGIRVTGLSEGTRIVGNSIGTDVTGQNVILNLVGIRVMPFLASEWPTSTVIGGLIPGEGNAIAFSEREGVVVSGSTQGATISGNSIHGNGNLGIDLLPAGVTPNDPLDSDSGPNGLQNFPVVATATTTRMGTAVTGTLSSAPNAQYTLEFFANDACDPSGHGEGRRFLGSTEVVTDASGNGAFAVLLPAPASAGEVVTATATDSQGNTSEFSACVPVTRQGVRARRESSHF